MRVREREQRGGRVWLRAVLLAAVTVQVVTADPSAAETYGECQTRYQQATLDYDQNLRSCLRYVGRPGHNPNNCTRAAEVKYHGSLASLTCRPPDLNVFTPPNEWVTKVVGVRADQQWVDTGLTFNRPDCSIYVETFGKWSNAGLPSLGAEGYRGVRWPGTIHPEADLGSLIGRFEFGDGKMIAISDWSAFEKLNSNRGRLELAMNDTPNYADNQGRLWVALTFPRSCAYARQSVRAADEWTNTGIFVGGGQPVDTLALGTWSNAPSAAPVAAAGYAGYRHPGQRFRGADFASLIGRVSGSSFSLATDDQGEIPASGEILLGMNDLPGGFTDNTGALEVEINFIHLGCTPVVLSKGVERCVNVRDNGDINLHLDRSDTGSWEQEYVAADQPKGHDKSYCGPTAGKNLLYWYDLDASYPDLAAEMKTEEWDTLPIFGFAGAACAFEPVCTSVVGSTVSKIAVKFGTLPRDMMGTLRRRMAAIGYEDCGSTGVLSLAEISESLASGHPVVILESKGSGKLHWAVVTGLFYENGEPTLRVANSTNRTWSEFVKDWKLSEVGNRFVRKVMTDDLLGFGLEPYTKIHFCRGDG